MGASHTFIRGKKASQIPLDAADQRSGAREAGRRIHRCWSASRRCQPAACGQHRLWNVSGEPVAACMAHGAHLAHSSIDAGIEAVLPTAGGVASTTFSASAGCVHTHCREDKVWRANSRELSNALRSKWGDTVMLVWHSGVVGGAQWGITSFSQPRLLHLKAILALTRRSS